VSSKYEFIDAQKVHYPLSWMFGWAQVSSSGFYEWRNRPASATAERRDQLKASIEQVFAASRQTYGYRRVHAELARQGVQAGPELVRAVMREAGLAACQPRPWRVTTIPDAYAEPTADLVDRDFTAPAPGAKLVGDITYIKTWPRSAFAHPDYRGNVNPIWPQRDGLIWPHLGRGGTVRRHVG